MTRTEATQLARTAEAIPVPAWLSQPGPDLDRAVRDYRGSLSSEARARLDAEYARMTRKAR